MISNIPDDLLFGILSFVPVREAMNTSLLSKRWESLWKMMPVLKYSEKSFPDMTFQEFVEFFRRSLQLNEAPVLETLTIKIKQQQVPLKIQSCLPGTVFQKLVVLKLHTIRYLEIDDSPPGRHFSAGKPSVCFQSLKGLHLTHVGFREEQSFCRLISACPVVEDLFFNTVRTCAPKTIFRRPPQKRLEINTPYLKYLKIKNITGRLIFTTDMPNLVEATLKVDPSQTNDFLRIVTSVEFLSIHLYANEVLLLADKISQRLFHLELCIYGKISRNLLLHLLKHSPKLRVLKLQEIHHLSIEPAPADPYQLYHLRKFNDPPPSRVSITSEPAYYGSDEPRLEISTPCLKYLKIFDRLGYYNFLEDMPKLVEADVSVDVSKNEKLLTVLSSVEHLVICLYPSMVLDVTDSLIFNRLLHLKLDVCNSFRSNALLSLLKHFPNLQSLKLGRETTSWI
ncbi:unnamed protein product [Eruca vesicaria subsp. sativa]|uniref:F-box domain-containing protein n=1 Tax=Eruca vesicaria subsp. sativa TaxID=29727 RepID=A0ABC8LIS7_ERUVS|nr:unnamed protein product [Eruca vesicaria subsp. sativa]